MNELLLKTCGACLRELLEQREATKSISNRVALLSKQVAALAKAEDCSSPPVEAWLDADPQGSAAPAGPVLGRAASPGLPELCAVEDQVLRRTLVAACQQGQLRLELRDLARRAAAPLAASAEAEGRGAPEGCPPSFWAAALLRDTLLQELRRGNLRAVVFRASVGGAASLVTRREPADVEAALEEELLAANTGQEARASGEVAVVVLAPVFRRSSWQLLEAALCWCRQERVQPAVGVLLSIVRSLLPDGYVFRDVDLLALLGTAPDEVDATLIEDAEGQMVLSRDGEPELPAVPPAELAAVAEASDEHAATLRVLRGASNPAGCEAGGLWCLGIVDALLPLRGQRISRALGLPQVLQGACASTLLRACSAKAPAVRALSNAVYAQRVAPTKPSGPTVATAPTMPASMVPAPKAFSPVGPMARSAATAPAPAPRPMLTMAARPETTEHTAGTRPGQVAGAASWEPAPQAWSAATSPKGSAAAGTTVGAITASWGPLPLGVQPLTRPAMGAVAALPGLIAAPTVSPHGLLQAEATAPDSSAGDAEEEQGEGLSCDGTSMASGQPPQGRLLNVSEQQMAFIECFKDELFRNRPLPLSQLNNLYKMRSGEDLPYKLTGYQKLRDFILDVPGLSLTGRGNRMQVLLEDPSKLEVFQNSMQQAQMEANSVSSGSMHTPSFRMPKPLPELLLQQLYELFLSCESNEIPLRSFVNVWNKRYPSEQLAFRELGFRDVRGLLSQVSFIEKVGNKSDCRYVLRHSDDPPPLATRRVSAAASPVCAHDKLSSLVRPLQPAGTRLEAQATRRVSPHVSPLCTHDELPSMAWPLQPAGTRLESPLCTHDELPSLVRPLQPAGTRLELQASSVDSSMVARPLQGAWPAQSPVRWTLTATQAAAAGSLGAQPEIEVMGQDAAEWPPSAPGTSAQPGQVHAQPPKRSQSPIAMLRGFLENHTISRGGELGAAGGDCPTPTAIGCDGLEPAVSGLAMQQIGRWPSDGSCWGSSGPGAIMGMHGQHTTMGTSPAPGWDTPDSYAGLPPATLEALGCAPGYASVQGSRPQSIASSHGLGSATGMPWDQGLGSPSGRSAQGLGSSSGLARDQSLGAQLSAHVLGSLNGLGSGHGQDHSHSGCRTPCLSAIFQDAQQLPQPATAAFKDPRPSGVEPPRTMLGDPEPRPTELPREGMLSVEESLARAMNPARRLPRAKKSANFVSTPGAFSSETRDACIHQGKFDMGSVLQMQLPRDTPCLVCDISGGQVVVTNVECEELFEETSDTRGHLVQSDIFDLIHPNDRDKLSTCFTYLMVSERTEMDPQEIRIITRAGRVRAVRTQGMQLIGMWWQLDFWRLGSEE